MKVERSLSVVRPAPRYFANKRGRQGVRQINHATGYLAPRARQNWKQTQRARRIINADVDGLEHHEFDWKYLNDHIGAVEGEGRIASAQQVAHW
jgi:hypothetical protein